MIDKIRKTREYLDYLEEHYLNVQKAWKEIQDKCKDMRFVWDDYFFATINCQVINHDESKLSAEEFTRYRNKFFPAVGEDKNEKDFNIAWEHHKKRNLHHWQTWTKENLHYIDWETSIVHMVIDWMAMGYKFGDNAKQYYESNSSKIKIDDKAKDFIYDIFNRLEKTDNTK